MIEDIHLFAYPFQFEHRGKLLPAAISHEALQDFFGATTTTFENSFNANAYEIRKKARDVFESGEVRSPFLLITRDFKN